MRKGDDVETWPTGRPPDIRRLLLVLVEITHVDSPPDSIMPSNLHESFVDILRSHRGVALRLALQVEVPLEVPAWQWLLVPGEFADPAGSPELFRTDLAMVAFADPADPDRALESLHVEAQLGVDPSKSRAVPIYRAGMRSRYDCPGWGLMLSPVDRVIEWATNDLLRREPELRPFIVGRQHVQRSLACSRPACVPGSSDRAGGLGRPSSSSTSTLQ